MQRSDYSALLQQQTVLAKFGELALRSDDLDELLTEACRLVGEGLGTNLAKVMQLQADGTTLLVRAGVGWKPGIVGEVVLRAVDGTSEGYALKTGAPMISPDIATETRFVYPSFLVEHGVKARANVLILGGQDRPPFGILQVDSREPRQFTEENTTFLRSYANLIAAAVDRLRVFGEVREGEERLRLALEAGELGSWELDLATGLATHTHRAMRIFGYAEQPAAWTYSIFLDHVLDEDRERVDSTFRQAVATGTDWHFECRIHRAGDGEVRWIEATGKFGGDRAGAAPTRGTGILADITNRRAAEQELRDSNEVLEAKIAERTRELTEANEKREQVAEALRQSNKMEAVGQLTGGLAHDFNNLLAGISGSLELIRIRTAQGRTAELERYIEAALASTHRAAALTHRLLAFSRRQTLDPKAADLNKLVGGVEELYRRTVGPSIQIETRLADGLWPTLCDSNQLESALLNLVINARDAMPDGGQLVIRTANTVPLGLPDASVALPSGPVALPSGVVLAGEYVTLTVTDTGAGMAPDVLARAFDPFFTTKPLGQGTGLGLSMIHGFVQQSGGQIHLRSEEGQGTTVTIYLPRHLGAMNEATEAEAASLTAAGTGSVVLLVEDEAPIRMVIVDVLSDLGFTVLEAIDGRSGLHIVESAAHIDLLVTDVGLPGGMNGRQLADAARHRRPGLKVLFITGYAEGAVVSNSLLDLGMQVMTKPFGVEALAARVQGIISH